MPKRILKTETVIVKGVRFELTGDADGRITVSRNGHPIQGHLQIDQDGCYKVGSESFRKLGKAVYRLAYWYTSDEYKRPLRLERIKFPDGSVSQLVRSEPDNSLQLTLWQIEATLEVARHLIAEVASQGADVLGKTRVYKTEVGLNVHRAIELMLKVLLGSYTDDDWSFDKSNYGHDLSLLHDKLETKSPETASRLDEVFQNTVMVHGDPTFGSFGNPISVRVADGLHATLGVGEGTHPGAKHLRDHLVLMDMHSTYRQAYLGDAVQLICEAYLSYVADADPYLNFIETSMDEVVGPTVEHFLNE